MKYQCEVCGRIWHDQVDASSCERRCESKKRDSCQHEWWYWIDHNNDEIGRSCHKCHTSEAMVVGASDIQPDLADLWERKKKAKEAAT